MGCITSGIDNSEAFMLSRKIDEKLKLEGIDFRRQVKLLLLGTGESGKSTILKQLKVIHEKGFTDKEKEDYKYIIWGNITHSLRLLLESCLKHTALSKELHEKAQGVLGLIEEDSGNLKLPGKLSESIVNLWSHTEFKELCKNKDVCQVWTGDGVSYFLDNIERVISPSYVPSSYEIMLARSKTTGIVERSFIYKDLKFR
ncbi:guanine nucleotide-binding protein alpha-16 subunit-like [Zophobas morio]|jgi:guanine nucleotide-binding protein G(i) subunit alpha|uniref:guanine nucleotide-binding protein alpha-16 subunit-like n=1 Tax=Zophobas morio TaxID=2755281 RepID=UPI003083C8A7